MKPETGMQFKSREEAQQFLNMYSFAAGFSIAVVSVYRTTRKKRNNEITRATIKCNKHRHNTETENEQVVA
jgi:cbb3-type cytochrome oxidase subunit 3